MKMFKAVTVIAIYAVVFSVIFIDSSAKAAPVSVFLNAPEDGQACAKSDPQQQEADNFQITADFLDITAVRWWGAYGSEPNSSSSDNFTIRFFTDTGEGPAGNSFAVSLAVETTRTETSMTASAWSGHDGGIVYEYFANLTTPITVSAATTYYLSIVNDVSLWGWLESGSPSHWWRAGNGSDWTLSQRSTNLSFELYAVPEPMTVCLLGLGALTLLRRGKK